MLTATLSPCGPIKPLLKSWADASGRTIKSVTAETIDGCFGGQFLVFRFTDGSGLVIQHFEGDSGGGYCGYPATLDDNYSDDRRQRVYFGIDSLEEYTKAEEESDAKSKAEAAAQERATFERLKHKYEGH